MAVVGGPDKVAFCNNLGAHAVDVERERLTGAYERAHERQGPEVDLRAQRQGIAIETGGEILLVHGSPLDPSEPISHEMTDEEMSALISDDPADIVICGASHVGTWTPLVIWPMGTSSAIISTWKMAQRHTCCWPNCFIAVPNCAARRSIFVKFGIF